MDALILLVIAGYQRHISPRKGFRCAHSVLHGGAGCSGAIYRAIEEQGWRRGTLLARERFRDCHLAAQILRAESGDGEDSGSGSDRGARNRNRSGRTCDACDFDPCFWLDLADCFPADALCSHAHAAPCDGGAPGVSPCDCSPCDCHPFH